VVDELSGIDVGAPQPAQPSAQLTRQQEPLSVPPLPKPADFGRPGALVAALGALWLALHEISALSGQFLTIEGEHATFNELGGPMAVQFTDRWRDLYTQTQLADWKQMLGIYLILDAAFVGCYAVALLAFIRTISTRTTGQPQHWLCRVVWALVLVDIVEDLAWVEVGMVLRDHDSPVAAWVTYVLAGITTVKCLLVAMLVLAGAHALLRSGATVRRRARELGRATFIQRFSLLAFLPIAVLAIVPLAQVNNLFDQLPDVQRAWLDSWQGARHGVAAAIAFTIVLLTIFVLGRLRADWAYRRVVDPNWPHYDVAPTNPETDTGGVAVDGPRKSRQQKVTFWLTGPILLGVLAVAVKLSALDGEVFWTRLLLFCSVPVLVTLLSLLLRTRGYERLEPLPPVGIRYATDVLAVGDILAVAALSLTGFGLIRAFTGEATLASVGLLDLDPGWVLVVVFLALVLGFLLAIVPWLISHSVLTRLADSAEKGTVVTGRLRGLADSLRANDSSTRAMAMLQPGRNVYEPGSTGVRAPGGAIASEDLREGWATGLLALSILFFLWLAMAPRWWAYDAPGGGLGVLAVAVLTVGTLILMLGQIVAYAQRRQPPELFQWLRVVPRPQRIWQMVTGKPTADTRWFRSWRATPAILLMTVAVLTTSVFGGRTDVHPVAGTGTIPDRPILAEAFAWWQAQEDGCRVPYLGNGAITLRPMVMYAAEGGGIRATYWTASALQQIGSAGTGCARHSTLFSGGASGGALGLTLARFDPEPLRATRAIAGPEALAVASVSMLSGDLLTSAAGIRFSESTPHRTTGTQLLDRTGLMETAWEEKLENLRTPFLPETDHSAVPTAPDAVTGHLILTSSAARDGCRALLSQIDLSHGLADNGHWPTCGGSAAGRHSWDLFAAYSTVTDDAATVDTTVSSHCLGNVPALTAGLLASRFPYVTPSGTVGGCNGLDPTQLIDGGYTDNTGLGTITSLANLWAPLVRQNNDQVLAAGRGELIMPLVVFLENGAGSDYAITREEEATEITEAREATPAESSGDWWWASRSIPEVLVPPLGNHNARDHKVRANRALAQAGNEVRDALCTPPATGGHASAPPEQLACLDLLDTALAVHPVFVIHQTAQPSIAAPLGWSLSKASQSDLDADMTASREHGRTETPNDPASKAGYGSLYDLLEALGVTRDDGASIESEGDLTP